jgi:hypothetical protein
LARCDPVLAVAEFENLNTSEADPEEANSREHAARARRVLFGDLVRTGHYALAERVLGNGDPPLGGSEDFDGLAADFAGGLYLLNHAANYAGAADLFGRLRENAFRALAEDVAAEEIRRLLLEADLAWLTALARCDASATVAAYEGVSKNPARLDPDAYRPHRSRAFRRLLSDLINLGHYDVAEQILRRWPEDEREMGETVGREGFAWGLYLLNHRADYPAAASMFARIWQQAQDNPADAALLWPARFHQGLASRHRGDARTAALIAAEIGADASAALPVPAEFLARLGELLPPAS